ncbi:MAG: tRNA uridine-5-carboxymethylaminomethyl(34) synthesis GTPase MnmE [Lentisphaeria bacterium]|nr:tRNA uridine-5-carboxymethylaminomethyl(34) synthesis GTPase MnmE [Lentisphaeria bacterium]
MNVAPDMSEDTIAAIAGGVGGAVSIVRVSGETAMAVADKVWRSRKSLIHGPPRRLALGRVVDADGAVVDQCLAVVFPGAASYTGEPMVEFHTHGGALVPRKVLQCLLSAGARLAAPGEFTKRAFINGKMDLTQAEAVGDLISAHSEMALRLANRQLQGSLSCRVNAVFEELTAVLADVESRMDFPEEHLDWMPPEALAERLRHVTGALNQLLAGRHVGEVLRDGVRLVIAGGPNVGKSSLLNCFLGRDRAIVTEIPGTTRDTLEELAHVRGIPVRLTDTAGIRETRDVVEKHGIDRSKASLKEAQVVLWVYDIRSPETGLAVGDHLSAAPVIHVANKVDLVEKATASLSLSPGHVAVSAVTGQGLETLYDQIEAVIWERPGMAEPEYAVNARHGALLEAALSELADTGPLMEQELWELAAVHLRSAAEDVGRITGRTASIDVLDTIFAKFCIGK